MLNGNPSSSSGFASIPWKKLWKLPIPPKVRNFWWRVIHKFVPCRGILKERHVEKIANCEDCGEVESIFHTFFKCTWALLFWEEIKRITSVKIPMLHPESWSMDMIERSFVPPQNAAIPIIKATSVPAV